MAFRNGSVLFFTVDSYSPVWLKSHSSTPEMDATLPGTSTGAGLLTGVAAQRSLIWKRPADSRFSPTLFLRGVVSQTQSTPLLWELCIKIATVLLS